MSSKIGENWNGFKNQLGWNQKLKSNWDGLKNWREL